ncbi:MAG: hypothetical protein ACPGKS_01615, partial [Coraliomargarita sp.]
MRFLLPISLLIGGAWFIYKNQGNPITSLQNWLSTESSQIKNICLVNKAGVELDCRIIGKKADFLVIERSSDNGFFLVDSYTLERKSRRKVEALRDFKEDTVNEHLFREAQKSIRVELMYVAEHNYFRCDRTGEKMKTCTGSKVDAFRAFLRKEAIDYRESNLQTTPVNERYVDLPNGIQSVPCI